MTLDEIRRVLLETRARLRAHLPEWRDAVDAVLDVENALAHPGPLLTDDEVFDEVIVRGDDLLTDILDQLSEGAIVAYLAERQERAREAKRAVLASSILHPAQESP